LATKSLDHKIIAELVRNARVSDRKLAKAVGVSQPTVTRRRTSLEKDGVLEYTAIPNLGKLGFEILVLSFYSWTPEATDKLAENQERIRDKLHRFLVKHKNIIFTANGEGFGMQRMMISVHESYSDYMRLTEAVRKEWGEYLSKSASFIISLETDVVGRQLSFKPLAESLAQKT